MPRRSASARSGRCGKSGLTLNRFGALPRLDLKESCGRQPGTRKIRDAAVRRKARHALSGKPVPNPLPRSALVGEAPGHEGKWRARPSDSQGRDLTHEKSRRDPGSPSLTKLKGCWPAPRAFAGFFERTVAGQIKKQEPG